MVVVDEVLHADQEHVYSSRPFHREVPGKMEKTFFGGVRTVRGSNAVGSSSSLPHLSDQSCQSILMVVIVIIDIKCPSILSVHLSKHSTH